MDEKDNKNVRDIMGNDPNSDSKFMARGNQGEELEDHSIIYQNIAEILNEPPDSLTAPRIGPLIDERTHARLSISEGESIALVDSAAILSFILEKNKLNRHGPSVTKPGFFARLLEQKVAANHFEGWPNNSKNIMATSMEASHVNPTGAAPGGIGSLEKERSLNNTSVGQSYNTLVAKSFEASVLGPKQGELLKKNSAELARIEKKLDDLTKLIGGARAGAAVADGMAVRVFKSIQRTHPIQTERCPVCPRGDGRGVVLYRSGLYRFRRP